MGDPFFDFFLLDQLDCLDVLDDEGDVVHDHPDPFYVDDDPLDLWSHRAPAGADIIIKGVHYV